MSVELSVELSGELPGSCLMHPTASSMSGSVICLFFVTLAGNCLLIPLVYSVGQESRDFVYLHFIGIHINSNYFEYLKSNSSNSLKNLKIYSLFSNEHKTEPIICGWLRTIATEDQLFLFNSYKKQDVLA